MVGGRSPPYLGGHSPPYVESRPPIGMLQVFFNRPLHTRRLSIALLLLCACRPDVPPEPPRIEVDETTHGFGRVEQGVETRHAFTITNSGGGVLVVDRIRTACDVHAEIEPASTLTAGGTARLEVTWDTSRLHGGQERTLTIYSNDPRNDIVTLRLGADIAAAVAAEPPELYVGRVQRGTDAPVDLRLRLLHPEARVADISASSRVLEVSLEGDASDRPVRVRIRDEAPAGVFEDAIVVHLEDRTSLQIPVAGVVGAEEGSLTER